MRALLLAVLSLPALLARAAEGPRPIDPATHRVGERIAECLLADGKRLSDLARAVVVISLESPDCPIARKIAPKLARFAGEYGARGVLFAVAKPEEAARALGATSTTDFFLLDEARTLRYRGAIDDQVGLGYVLEAPRRNYLRDALDAVLAGREAEVRATSAPGCVVEAPPAPPPSPPVTWHGRVSRIIQARCQECHREGQNAPFAFDTLEEVRSRAATVRREVQRGAMPPWFAGPGSLPMANDRGLSERERGDLLDWIDAGCPAGEPAEAPRPVSFPKGWTIGEPDVVFELPAPFRVPAEGAIRYHLAVVPTGLEEDCWVKAMEVRPTAPQAVHHALVFLRYPAGHPLHQRRPSDRDGLSGYFAGMVPGQNALVLPDGCAKKLPAGAMLLFQIHYTAQGREVTDRTRLGLIFAKEPPRHEVHTTAAFDVRFKIPPGAAEFPVVAHLPVPVPVRLMGFMPHTHVRGRAFRYELMLPDGSQQLLLDVPRYDFNWQLYYQLREELLVPGGTLLRATATYDNSEANPANPDPSAEVRFGEQTWDEMMIGYVDYVLGP
ncbi:MAG: hypothetical protein ACT4PV_03390 [Planctomycetaceae bacterium]